MSSRKMSDAGVAAHRGLVGVEAERTPGRRTGAHHEQPDAFGEVVEILGKVIGLVDRIDGRERKSGVLVVGRERRAQLEQ